MGCFSSGVEENFTESSPLNVKISVSDSAVLIHMRMTKQTLKTSFLGNLIFSVQLGKGGEQDENRS